MLELKFRDDKSALKKLARAQRKVDKYVSKHPGKLNARERKKLGKKLNGRAKALSRATGMEIHSLFE
ncbi:hypothetical protein [Faecalicatena contorta]|uniref:hypothetical protein n=1 Tax=Faecalicatena contorta TaxID=39482 RepID=UPI001F249849|nr:hypothetical protein [Faecalicatena contorta]MCF2554395.1 hypothetical protein [Faecalicatena contorta]